MEINKQLFEDVLSGKLKGTFVLRNGNKMSHKTLHRTTDDSYPYAVSEGDTLGFYCCFSDTNKFSTDIIDFIPDTDMKENELTIEIPDGKIVDWDESKKQNKIVLKDRQLTYEDVCKDLFENKKIFYIGSDSAIYNEPYSVLEGCICHRNNAASRHQLECILAKNKLANVAKYLNDGWKPGNGSDIYYIDNYHGNLVVYLTKKDCGMCLGQSVFKTKELAQQAIKILGEETVKLALEHLGI